MEHLITKGQIYRLKNLTVCVRTVYTNYADCIVVEGNETYPVCGYDISVPTDELLKFNQILLNR